MILISFTHLGLFRLPLEMMVILGVIILLILVAIGVSFFIAADHQTKIYEELEYENCELSNEQAEQIRQAKRNFSKPYTNMIITATVLCILSAVPLLCGVFFTKMLNGSQMDHLMTGLVAGTLVLVAIGVFFFIKSNITMDSYNILLQTDDYTPKKKNGRRIMNKYAAVYWLTATMLYLGYSFLTNNWEHSWIIWPIAGILYGIIEKVLSLKNNDIAPE
ncbi:hypothetical protein DM475_07170 [Lactobacillus helveticus]|uniref:XRE family transcriptional regulator n=2 Tax=Lactobacillus helveticus TaxID=1587 RepID=A0AAV4EA37_LACHE|nr:hypothetical protein [Lactobacillus helveticus]MCT3404326.1 hypothetical protein [Lactobacillus helveticus]MCT3407986.1 hypothetical protein [Lactobacillus helveticus]MCT3419438.1 hypothetical protein [Lactobacillus helveticus]MCT3421806.1 hypothetical protein [Lactobacillus helveticus]